MYPSVRSFVPQSATFNFLSRRNLFDDRGDSVSIGGRCARVSKVNGTRMRLGKNAIKIARAWGGGGCARGDCYYGQRKCIFFYFEAGRGEENGVGLCKMFLERGNSSRFQISIMIILSTRSFRKVAFYLHTPDYAFPLCRAVITDRVPATYVGSWGEEGIFFARLHSWLDLIIAIDCEL